MLISRTPLRVSFVGGGSDVVSFAAEHGGAVVSTAIDKYVYVAVNKRFEETTRVSYSRTEIVASIDELEHELAREALRTAGIPRGTEIVTIADVPVGGHRPRLLQRRHRRPAERALRLPGHPQVARPSWRRRRRGSRSTCSASRSASRTSTPPPSAGCSCSSSGRAAASGGRRWSSPRDRRRRWDATCSCSTPGARPSGEPLERLNAVAGEPETVARLERLRDDALALFRELSGGAGPDVLGEAMHESWQRKRELPGVTDAEIDGWYEAARAAGAIGGKLLGSGSGGFLLVYVPVERQAEVRRALGDLREFAFAPETEGTRIIYVGR